jgi:hypothetical protein
MRILRRLNWRLRTALPGGARQGSKAAAPRAIRPPAACVRPGGGAAVRLMRGRRAAAYAQGMLPVRLQRGSISSSEPSGRSSNTRARSSRRRKRRVRLTEAISAGPRARRRCAGTWRRCRRGRGSTARCRNARKPLDALPYLLHGGRQCERLVRGARIAAAAGSPCPGLRRNAECRPTGAPRAATTLFPAQLEQARSRRRTTRRASATRRDALDLRHA